MGNKVGTTNSIYLWQPLTDPVLSIHSTMGVNQFLLLARAGEHSDYGAITLLFQDDAGGLEVSLKANYDLLHSSVCTLPADCYVLCLMSYRWREGMASGCLHLAYLTLCWLMQAIWCNTGPTIPSSPQGTGQQDAMPHSTDETSKNKHFFVFKPNEKHRVSIPQEEDKYTRHRYSVAFFTHPNHGTDISPLECCVSDHNPSHYPQPVSAGEYLRQKLNASY